MYKFMSINNLLDLEYNTLVTFEDTIVNALYILQFTHRN